MAQAFKADKNYDDDALISQLGGDETSNAMPVTKGPKFDPVTTSPPAVAAPPPVAAAPPARTPVTASTFQGFTPTHAMEGFDFNREQNTGKSAKDAFAYLANQAPPPPLNDKAALGAWFNQYIRPGMNELGHGADEATGDKFHFNNWQGGYDVDFGRGAGAEGGALAWQVDDGTAQTGTGAYQPRQTINPAALGGGLDQSALEQIIQEAQGAQQGTPSAIDQQALMELLA